MSDSSALPETAGDAALAAGVDDAPGLADAVLRLWRDGGLRARLAAAGRERARRFSWPACARATMAVYDRVLASRG
ncbi:TPA: hypothetical protein DCG35_02140 [Candidatus Edwardsbacteria bacterium]|nr:hypothetical protein [Candidatus Edwardsbacteria bacterium]